MAAREMGHCSECGEGGCATYIHVAVASPCNWPTDPISACGAGRALENVSEGEWLGSKVSEEMECSLGQIARSRMDQRRRSTCEGNRYSSYILYEATWGRIAVRVVAPALADCPTLLGTIVCACILSVQQARETSYHVLICGTVFGAAQRPPGRDQTFTIAWPLLRFACRAAPFLAPLFGTENGAANVTELTVFVAMYSIVFSLSAGGRSLAMVEPL